VLRPADREGLRPAGQDTVRTHQVVVQDGMVYVQAETIADGVA
jgi:hypothetical protein